MAARWEYRTVRIRYDDRRRKDWVVEGREEPVLSLSNGGALIGFSAILEAYGSRGWELVSLNLEESAAIAGFGQWHIVPRSYRATFRRPLEAGA